MSVFQTRTSESRVSCRTRGCGTVSGQQGVGDRDRATPCDIPGAKGRRAVTVTEDTQHQGRGDSIAPGPGCSPR